MTPDPSDERQLRDLLLDWEEQAERGEEVSAEALCPDRPALADELRRRITLLKGFDPTRHEGVSRQRSSRTSAFSLARYVELRLHANGGLGEVFEAHNPEFRRKVALKFLQVKHAYHSESRDRFLAEAQITGRLEHPGIVPIYGLGEDNDGHPCYVMRFIRGIPLDRAIRAFHRAKRHGLAATRRTRLLDGLLKRIRGAARDPGDTRDLHDRVFRELLNRFKSVCETVAYAHSKQVLHRDLKPSNIMLGKFGETLVVDWGLAKAFELPDLVLTESLSTLPFDPSTIITPLSVGPRGTPVFMSPEQAAARKNAGPASDVYSLGATLYCLLAGVLPFHGRASEVVEKVMDGKFPAPRTRTENIPKALEAVCLKAMSRDPEDRYVSANALADDIENWLADRPVNAWREPWPIRTRRWLGRHRTLMTSAAAFLLTSVVALTISTLFLNWEKHRTELARQEAVTNEREARRLAQIAIANEAQAMEQKNLAEQNIRRFKESVDKGLLSQLVTNVNFFISDVEMNELVLSNSLSQSLKTYELILTNDIGLKLSEYEKGTYYAAVGVINLSKQENSKAIAAFRKASDLSPTCSMFHVFLGATLILEGQLDEAIPILHKAVALDPKLAFAHSSLGRALNESRRYDEAIPILRKAVELDPKLALAYNNLGWALIGIRRYDEGIPILRKAVELDPKLAVAYNNLGWGLNGIRRYEEAIPILRKAVELDPKRALAHGNLGVALNGMLRYDEAIPILRKAVELDPKLAFAHSSLGHALTAKDRYDEAITVLQRAVALDPRSANAYLRLGRAMNKKGRYGEAISVLRRAIEIQPNSAPTYGTLRVFLLQEGRFAESLAALRRYRELLKPDDPAWQASVNEEQTSVKMVDLDVKLPRILRREVQVSNDTELTLIAQVCRYKKLYVTSARFWEEAFTAKPQLAEDINAGHRYNGACASALAGTGKGQDDLNPNAVAHAQLRARARDWLRADLEVWTARFNNGGLQDRVKIQQKLLHWQIDPDLAGIRDIEELVKLPEAERSSLRSLWVAVSDLQKRAGL